MPPEKVQRCPCPCPAQSFPSLILKKGFLFQPNVSSKGSYKFCRDHQIWGINTCVSDPGFFASCWFGQGLSLLWVPDATVRDEDQDTGSPNMVFWHIKCLKELRKLRFFFWPTHAVSHRIPPWGVHSPCGPVCDRTHLSCSSSSYYSTPQLSILHHPTIKTFDDFISVQRLPYLVRLTLKSLVCFYLLNWLSLDGLQQPWIQSSRKTNLLLYMCNDTTLGYWGTHGSWWIIPYKSKKRPNRSI